MASANHGAWLAITHVSLIQDMKHVALVRFQSCVLRLALKSLKSENYLCNQIKQSITTIGNDDVYRSRGRQLAKILGL